VPWIRYNDPVLCKPNRQEVIIILGTVVIGVLAVVAAKYLVDTSIKNYQIVI